MTHTWCVLVALLCGVGVGALGGAVFGWWKGVDHATEATVRMVARGDIALTDQGRDRSAR
jgi:hypothetical protein